MEELHDERTADPIGARRRVAVKPAVALLAAGVFAGLALTVIAGLTTRASDARGHDATIDGAVRQLNELQGVPWRFQITGTGTSGAAAARALRVSMLDGERAVSIRFAFCRATLQWPVCAASRRPCSRTSGRSTRPSS